MTQIPANTGPQQRRLAVVTLLAALVIVAGLVWVVVRWRQAEAALQDARRERDEAHAKRGDKESELAVRVRLWTEVAVVLSEQEPEEAPALRRRLLECAFVELETIRPQLGDERLRADARYAQALVLAALGDRKAAPTFRRALAEYRTLLGQDPEDLSLRRKLADTLGHLAAQEPPAQAFVTQAEAIQTYRQFLPDAPDDPGLNAGLALALSNRGAILLERDEREEARACLEEAAQRQQALANKFPGSQAAAALGDTVQRLGLLREREAGPSGSLCEHLHAASLRRETLERSPSHSTRQALVRSAREVAASLRAQGLERAAESALSEALALVQAQTLKGLEVPLGK